MEKEKIKIIIVISILLLLIIIGLYIPKKEEQKEIEYNDLISDTLFTKEELNVEKEKIKVHISGEVNYNGILELEKGDRIDDAIKKAGGITEDADIDRINLAYMLEDGQKILIPNKNSEKEEINDDFFGIVDGQENNEKVNINIAKQTELETLPGIGPSLALRMIKYREENGKFKSIEEIKNVKGMGESKFIEIKELIKVE